MAFSVRIKGISKESRRAVLTIEPTWWGCGVAYELRADDRFKDVSKDLGYEDLAANLSFEEMRILHERYKASPRLTNVERYELQRLETALYASVDTYSFFHVTVSEM